MSLYFLTTKHFETFLDLALKKPKFQIKALITQIFQLAYAIISSNQDLYFYFKDNDIPQKLYALLTKVFISYEFSLNELMFLLNLWINMCTIGDFYFLVEKYLFCKDFQIISPISLKKQAFSQKKHIFSSKNLGKIKTSMTTYSYYQNNLEIDQIVDKYSMDFADVSKYIRVKIPGFLDLIIRFLYEQLDLEANLKMFYITLIKSIIAHDNSYNAAFLANDILILRLLLSLRLEKEENIREEIGKILIFTLQSYINNHQLKAIFSLMLFNLRIVDFFHVFFRKNRDYTPEAIDNMQALFRSKENFLDSLHNLLKLLRCLLKNSSNSQEKPNKMLNFSGLNSGIIFTNLRFPIKAFSISLEFSLDNLLTPFKPELQAYYQTFQNIEDPESTLLTPQPQDHMIFSKWPEKKQLDSQHFSINSINNSPLNKKSLKSHKISSMNSDSSNKSSRFYCPRLFSLLSFDNNASLEIYINEKRFLNIELIDKTKILDTFRLKFEENQVYNLLIKYSQETHFQVFQKDLEIPSNKVAFPNLLEKFQYPKYFAIACSPEITKSPIINKTFEGHKSFKLENSLSGTLYSLKLIDKIGNPLENPNQNQQKSLNLGLFEFIEKNNFPSWNSWLSLIKSDPNSMDSQQIFPEIQEKNGFFNNMLNILHIGGEKNVKNQEKNTNFDIKCKGVAHLEKTGFLDFFLRFGNIEVFFFLIEAMVNKQDLGIIDDEKRYFDLIKL